MMRGWVVVILLLPGLPCPAATDAEIGEHLELWLEEPLDLRDASAIELQLLPWLSRWQAEAIVGLREAGGLRTPKDLLYVPGIDERVLAALEPFVFLDPSRSSWRTGQVEFVQRASPGGARRWGWVRYRGSHARGAWRWDGQRRGAGWLQARWKTGEIIGGDLRVGPGWAWAFSTGSARSRTGPVALAAGPALRGAGTTSTWRGGALRQRWANVDFLAAVRRDGNAFALIEAPFGSGQRVGFGWLRTKHDAHPVMWMSGQGTFRWRAEIARAASRPWRLASSCAWRGPRWRGGLDLSHASQASGGVDPITGQRVDRPHRALQAHGARVESSWRAQVLARRVWRGEAVAAVVDRVEGQVEGRNRGHRWQSRLRLTRRSSPSTEIVWSAGWSEGGRLARGLRLRWAGRDDRSAALVSAFVQSGAPIRWQIAAAGSGGDFASLWLTGVLAGSPLSVWIAPGGLATVFAVSVRTSTLNLGFWAALELDPHSGAVPQGGLRLAADWSP